MVRTTMFLGIAFTEALALIGFVVFILSALSRSVPSLSHASASPREGADVLTAVATVTAALRCPWSSSPPTTAARRPRRTQPAETDLNPIAPEVKEMVWGVGAFVVFASSCATVAVPARCARAWTPGTT